MRYSAAGEDVKDARHLYEQGKIRPLEEILQSARQLFPGKVLEVELEREKGRLVYELEILDSNGVVKEIYIDAASGKILSTKEDD